MSAAYDIAYYIANTLGQGILGLNGDIFVNLLYETPDNQIAVHQYGGKPSDRGMGTAADPDALENIMVQVAVRNLNAQTATTTAEAIYEAIDGLADVTINSVSYLLMVAMQPPFISKRDDHNRTTVVFNLRVQRRRPA